MRLRLLSTIVSALVISVLTAPAALVPINNSGGASPGSIDPNWTVNGGPVYVTDNTGFPFGPWLADDGTSSWISPQPSYVGPPLGSDAPGSYDYATTFDLTGLVPGTASLSILFTVDNDLNDVLLNGSSTGISGTGFTAFSGPVIVNTGFSAGVNSLVFQTTNLGGTIGDPAGFRAALIGTADNAVSNPNTNVPEPSTASLTEFGLIAGLVFFRRRTSKSVVR